MTWVSKPWIIGAYERESRQTLTADVTGDSLNDLRRSCNSKTVRNSSPRSKAVSGKDDSAHSSRCGDRSAGRSASLWPGLHSIDRSCA